MQYLQKYKENPEILGIVAEMFMIEQDEVLASADSDPQMQRAIDKFQNGVLTSLLGEDVWERIRRGESVIDSRTVSEDKLVVLIGNRARHGKDTLADMLSEEFHARGIETKRLSFAKPMKEIVAEVLNVTVEALEDMKNNDIFYRKMLQYFGSGEMKRVFGDDVWHQLAINQIMQTAEPVIIFSDYRFPAEGSGYANKASIQVIRPEVLANTDPAILHKSETALDDAPYDFKIINDGTLDDLRQKSAKLVDILENRVCCKIDVPSSPGISGEVSFDASTGKRMAP